MKLKISISISAIIITVALIGFSQIRQNAFTATEDFPREALVYIQISDLPALLKLWNESKLREEYTASENFNDFSNRHLGLKLASRWREFSDAAGFALDLSVLSGLTENRAAFALYDIGKLEFVFIAPVSSEVFSATNFFRNKNNFAEEILEDGTTVFRAKVKADRGRQMQELIFTHIRGRFILATSEKLFVQTLKNINGGEAINRLSDEPSFRILSEKIEPHAATVWVDQSVLNNDYYFNRYWLMSDAENLKNIRAGIFDFEMSEGKMIERRKFLLNQAINSSPITFSETEKIIASLPGDIPFYTLQRANPETIDAAIENTFFRRRAKAETKQKRRRYFTSYSDYDNYSYHNYYSLGESFDEAIDEEDHENPLERRKINTDFSKLLQTANPQAVVTFSQPKVLPVPLFIEFQHASIFHLASPAAFDRVLFESELEKYLSGEVMISSPEVKLNWETKTEKGASWRELKLPMLEWRIIYLVRGNELILTDKTELLTKILAAENPAAEAAEHGAFNKLTVLNFEKRKNVYDDVFSEFPVKNTGGDFFTANIKSLLDSLPEIKKITVKEQYLENTIDEEIIVELR